MTIRYSLNWEACLAHLLSVSLPDMEGGSTIYGLSEALDRGEFNAIKAKEQLAKTGFGLLLPGEVASVQAGYVLAVPNSSPQMSAVFELTRWAAAVSENAGLWKHAPRH